MAEVKRIVTRPIRVEGLLVDVRPYLPANAAPANDAVFHHNTDLLGNELDLFTFEDEINAFKMDLSMDIGSSDDFDGIGGGLL